MKNKKYFIVLLAVLALLIVGVGYAAVTKTLSIGGQATLQKGTLNVHFENATFATSSSNLPSGVVSDYNLVYSEPSSEAVGSGNLECSVSVDMTTKGSYVVFENYIVNDTPYYKANLSSALKFKENASLSSLNEITKLDDGVYLLGNASDDYYKVTVTIAKPELNEKTGDTADKTLVTIRIEMIKTPLTADEADTTITVTFTAEAESLK